MTNISHTKEQGMRVHKLANLGGLVAIAGLENIDLALLLGSFMQLAQQLPHLSLQSAEQLHASGLQKLHERKSEKRAYQHRSNAAAETPVRIDDVKKIIMKLGGKLPALEKDIIPELHRLLR